MEPQQLPPFVIEMIERESRIPYEECDSPIEDIFLWEFKKVASDQVTLRRQHQCQTRAGWFRLDFILTSSDGAHSLGIECDGKNFHSDERDSQRDATIVAAGVVQKVYRLRGRDIYFRIHDTLHLLSEREPWLFSERGLQNLTQLSAPEGRRNDVWGTMPQPGFPYGIMRSYGRFPVEDDERDDTYDEDSDMDEEAVDERQFATLICWTQRDG